MMQNVHLIYAKNVFGFCHNAKAQANAIYNKIKYSMTGCYKIYPINIYIRVSITIFKFAAQEIQQFMFYIIVIKYIYALHKAYKMCFSYHESSISIICINQSSNKYYILIICSADQILIRFSLVQLHQSVQKIILV